MEEKRETEIETRRKRDIDRERQRDGGRKRDERRTEMKRQRGGKTGVEGER